MQVALQLTEPFTWRSYLYFDVAESVMILNEVGTDVPLEYPPLTPTEDSQTFLTFKYRMPGVPDVRTLKVFARCADTIGSPLIDVGQGGNTHLIASDVSAATDYVSQCVEIVPFVQEADFNCDNFRVVFKGTTITSAVPILVKDVEFKPCSAAGSADCRKCSNFFCQTLYTDLILSLQRYDTIADLLSLQCASSDSRCINCFIAV